MTDKVIPEKCIGFKTDLVPAPFTTKDACTYALGLGYSIEPLDEKDLTYTYELSDGFQVLPTISSIWSTFNPFEILVNSPGFPKFNAMMLVHGEHKTEVFKTLDPSKLYLNQAEIADVADKGKGCLVSFLIKTYERNENGSKGDCALSNTLSLFVRGAGGFGFKGNLNDVIPPIPTTKPTKVLVQQTFPSQALIYRLSGDVNPLHVDINMAQAGGFDKPILHGLCTYGIAAKLIVQNYCDNDATKLKFIKTRFPSFVYPGDKLIFNTWSDGKGTVNFEAFTEERKKQVIMGYALIEPTQKL